MAGDVGRKVQFHPGYGGYIPSWQLKMAPVTSGPNTHMPLAERTKRSQPPKTAPTTVNNLSIYTTDMESSLSVSAGKLIRDSPKTKGQLRGLPSPKAFTATTIQQDMSASVTGVHEDPAFFSRLIKERQREQAEQADPNRRADCQGYSKRGHGSVAGLDCFHQHPAVAFEGDPGTPMPLLGATPFIAGDKMGAGHPDRVYANDADNVKFYRTTGDTSYDIEYGTLGSNPRDRLPDTAKDFADASTTYDLAPGTTRAIAKVRLPGYMGHIPTSDKNLVKVNGDDDALMQFHRSHLTLTMNQNVPGYAGHQPQDLCRPLLPNLALTTSGIVSKYVAEDKAEKALKGPSYGRTNAMQGFFTRGAGEDATEALDTYFGKYRPYEGLLKV